MIHVDSMDDVVGKVISEQPYVKILSKPRWEEIELVPGLVHGRWEAIAQVEHMLCIVELKIT